MGFTLFISDLHLCESRPNITAAFIAWMQKEVIKAESLYILGDFFEYWAGDDAIDTHFHPQILEALKQVVQKGTKIYLMHGNRDFLIDHDFASLTGVTLLHDPSLITLYGKRILLTHGDALCTDDVGYMSFRNQVRQPSWQSQFLNQSVDVRKSFIREARLKSESEKSTKTMAIMDVNTEALESTIRAHHYPAYLIHGHTHQPNVHQHIVDDQTCVRYVLGDWYEQGSYLKINADGSVQIGQVDCEMRGQ
ncbi:MAG: UDP-2,3-diacylglucosamine diphosphatase [Methylophilus sp.]